MQKFLREVEAALRPYRDRKRASASAHIMNTKLEYWGIPVPIQRRVFKRGFSFSRLPHQQQAEIWNYIWKHSKNFEVMKQPLFYFEQFILRPTSKFRDREKSKPVDWLILKTWVNEIENWEHSDNYCKIISNLHERFPDQIYPALKKWNKSLNFWMRRCSVVSLFYYSAGRTRQPAFKKVIALIEPLIGNNHHYLHKAVGWTLRECHNVYPKQTFLFLEQNAPRLAAVTFSSAAEKLSAARKNYLKQKRKPSR